MPQLSSPWIEGKYGWNLGESGWNIGMDENLVKFSFLFDRNIDSIEPSVPLPPVTGKAYYISSEKRIYYVANGTYYSTNVPTGFVIRIKSTGAEYRFDGTNLIAIETVEELSSRIDSVETDLGSLGTAAFQDISFFTKTTDLADSASVSSGAALVGRNFQVVSTITELKALLKTSASTRAFVLGYYAANDGGGGSYYYDAADTTSLDNGGTIIVATDGGRWKLAYTGKISIRQFGAKGDNIQDDQPFIQAALDAEKSVYAPAGTYKLGSSILYKDDGYSIHGESMFSTVFTSTGTHSLIRNPDAATDTKLFCEIKDVKFVATSIGANIVVDWFSMQFGRIENVWILGQSTAGCYTLNLEATWTVTECTYNIITGCVFGLCASGIRITDGANNNTIFGNRVQPSLSGGNGIVLTATAAGRVSSNTIYNNGIEFPGQISNGINVLQNCTDIRIFWNRFESLLNGIVVGATGNTNIQAPYTQNYFSSNTTNINISAGVTSVGSAIRGSISTITAATVVTVVGRAYNMAVSRTGTGVYAFTFISNPTDAGYSINFCSSTHSARITAKTATGFTLTCGDATGVATDASFLDVSVVSNR